MQVSNEDRSDYTIDYKGNVVPKDSTQEATDEELTVDPRYLALKQQVKAWDEDIMVFINEEQENTVALTYREPSDCPGKALELLEKINEYLYSLEGVTPSLYHFRGDFNMDVTYQ